MASLSFFSFRGRAFWARPLREKILTKKMSCPIAVAYLAYLARKSARSWLKRAFSASHAVKRVKPGAEKEGFCGEHTACLFAVERVKLLRPPFCVLQKRDQIGQVLLAELLVQSRRHEGHGPGAHLRDFRPGDPRLRLRAGDQNDLIRRVLPQNAVVLLAALGEHDHRLVTADETRARINN